MTELLQVFQSQQISVKLVFELFLAVVCGGLIGYQRRAQGSTAGLRTHTLVCITSCLMMQLGVYMSHAFQGVEPTRLAAQVISGIGFLGAGAILKDGLSVTGLTTAGTIWAVGCIGLAIGGEFYLLSFIVSIIIFILLLLKEPLPTDKTNSDDITK